MIPTYSDNEAVNGGFGILALAFLNDCIGQMIPWLLVMIAVVICDLITGIRKSFFLKKAVSFSQALRRTMGKMITYFSFVLMVCMIQVASQTEIRIDVISCLLVCVIEGCSIFGNILRPKGYNLDLASVVAVFFSKLGVDKDDAKECLQKAQDQNEDPD